MQRRAKIVATIGPASSSEEMLGALLEAGVDVVRLNLSHGSHNEHKATLDRLRRLAAARQQHIPVLLDLMGPRYRLGDVPDGPMRLEPEQELTLGAVGSGTDLIIGEPALLANLQPGERVLIDNGLVEVRIEALEEGRARSRVVTGGTVSSRKGINLPDTNLPFAISDKDLADIALAAGQEADFLGVSYVGCAEDLVAVRRASVEAGRRIPLVAKLERGRAIEHVDEIFAEAHAVMVARGDLGVEVPLHTVPVLQKRIVDTGRRLGKPVIVATQMLESMMQHPRPSRAESSDVANAVLEGADALMLSGETAAGRHPVEAVRMMARIIGAAETYQAGRLQPAFQTVSDDRRERLDTLGEDPPSHGATHAVANAVAGAAVFTARRLGVRQIVAFSQGGFTARMIARYRPTTPIAVFTADPAVARRSQLLWGVRPLVIDAEVKHHDEVVRIVDRHLLAAGLVTPGERIVILMGDPIPARPLTNLMRVHTVGAD